jgi:hypothetical protein
MAYGVEKGAKGGFVSIDALLRKLMTQATTEVVGNG